MLEGGGGAAEGHARGGVGGREEHVGAGGGEGEVEVVRHGVRSGREVTGEARWVTVGVGDEVGGCEGRPGEDGLVVADAKRAGRGGLLLNIAV